MRISDWSSDVCSSDLAALEQPVLVISVIGEAADRALGARRAVAVVERAVAVLPAPDRIGVVFGQVRRGLERSEERRVGKEGVSKGRSRWLTHHQKKNNNNK